MAMGQKGNGNGHKGRPYGLMLLLAFGAALVGVMVLHKLRERRIFNLIVEEKNRQLVSLQLLLQKERDYTKEMGRKAEETKAKIYYLRNQKMELDGRLLEMLSRIDSLKDEQKTMESELEAKQNQIKLLRDKVVDTRNENPQIIALTATLKKKEAEIEELKQRLTTPVRVWSVSTDDPSNQPVNITVMGSMEQKGKTEFSLEESGRVNESSTEGQDGNGTKFNLSQAEEKREGVEDGIEKKGNYRIDGEKNHVNATDTIDDVDEQEKRSSFNGQLGKLEDPHQEGEIQELQRSHEGGKKPEIDENSRISRLQGRLGHLSKTKGKRWRVLARNRLQKKKVNSGIEAVENMTRRFSKEHKDVVRSREERAVSEEQKAKRDETETSLTKEMDDRKANLFRHQNSEDTEDMKDGNASAEISHQVKGGNAMQRNHGVNGEASNYAHKAEQVKVEEAAAATNIKQNMNSMNVRELGKKAELNSADGDEMEEDTTVAYEQEPETEADNGDLPDSDGKEEYKEETDEFEF